MKITKRYIAVLLLCTLLSTISFAADALNDVNTNESITFDSSEINYNDAELMPMAANSCDETDYSYIDGMTFGNTAAGLNYTGIPFSGSGLEIILISPIFKLKQEQHRTDLCAFVWYKNKDKMAFWFKVNRW